MQKQKTRRPSATSPRKVHSPTDSRPIEATAVEQPTAADQGPEMSVAASGQAQHADNNTADLGEFAGPSALGVKMIEIDGKPCPVWGVPLSSLESLPEVRQGIRVAVPDLAARGRVSMITGAPKAGKSTFTMSRVAQASHGSTAEQGVMLPPQTSLVVQLEEHPADMYRTLRTLNADLTKVVYVRRLGKRPCEQLRVEVKAAGATIVVIDSLAAFIGGHVSESNPDAIGAELRDLADVARELDVAIIVLHHSNKRGAYRGSTAIAAAVDQLLSISADEHDATLRIVDSEGRLGFPSFAYRLVDKESLRFEMVKGNDLSAALAQQKKLDLEAAVLKALAEGPLGAAVLRSKVGGNATAVDEAVERLKEAGRIEHLGRKSGWAIKSVQDENAPPADSAPARTGLVEAAAQVIATW